MRNEDPDIILEEVDKTVLDEDMVYKIDEMIGENMKDKIRGRRVVSGFEKRELEREQLLRKKGTAEQAKGWESYLHSFFANELKEMCKFREELLFDVESLSLQESQK